MRGKGDTETRGKGDNGKRRHGDKGKRRHGERVQKGFVGREWSTTFPALFCIPPFVDTQMHFANPVGMVSL